MAVTTLSLASYSEILPNYDMDTPTKDRFHIDVGSGSTWNRIASNVAGTDHNFDASPTTYVTYWSCPGFRIAPTDSVRVTMEGVGGDNVVYWSKTATTPPLGVNKLDAAQWVFTRQARWDIDTFYITDTSVTGVTYRNAFEALATVRDFVGAAILQMRLQDDICQTYDGATWNTIATGLTPGDLNEMVFDTHAWTISINGGTPVACEPLTLPVYPIGELKFEMIIGSEMYFGQLRYE